MKTVIGAILVSFLVCLVGGQLLMPLLVRLKIGQPIRDVGPKTHQTKSGTPTMGGIFIVLGMLAGMLIFAEQLFTSYATLVVAGMALCYGIIGFLDDFIKVYKHHNEGLTVVQKLVPQLLLAVGLALFCYFSEDIGSSIWVPFLNVEWDLGIFYIPFAVFTVVAVVNGVNLTDGVDGLLSGVTLVLMTGFTLICYFLMTGPAAAAFDAVTVKNMAVCAAATAGACLGFLRFNANPAKVFMGDTGSLALGGGVVALVLVLRMPLMLVIMGFAYVASCLSVVLQVGYFKLTKGKRLFRMSPLHHHFELGGMKEQKIVAMYMIVTTVLCLVAMLSMA